MDLIKVILAEGDSWTAGDIIDPEIQEDLKGNVNSILNDDYRLPKVWPFKLACKLGKKVVNNAVAGSSNDGIVRRTIDGTLELLKTYDASEIHVIIGLTSPERKDFYHKKDNDYGWDVLYPLDSSDLTEERKLFKRVYSSIYWNKEEYISRYLQSVFLVHQFLQCHGIHHTFFNAFYQDNDGSFGLDLHKSIERLQAKSSESYLRHLKINNVIDRYKYIVRDYFALTSFKSYIDKFGKDVYDGLHPNEDGHEVWAEYLYQYFTKKATKSLHDMINLARLDKPTEAILDHYKDIPEIKDVDQRGFEMIRPLFSHTNINGTMRIWPQALDEHKEGDSFMYCVMLHHDEALCGRQLRKLPLHVIKGLKNDTCKLVLDGSLEGKPAYKFFEEIYVRTTNMELNRKNIFYVTNNLYAEEQHEEFKSNNLHYTEFINVISYMYNVGDIQRLKDPTSWLYSEAHLPEYIDIEEEIEFKKENLDRVKHFLKVNRTGRPERNLFMLFVNARDLYDKFKISFPDYANEEFDEWTRENFAHFINEDNINDLKAKTPFDIDESDKTNHGAPGTEPGTFNADLPFHPKHYRDTFISIVFCAFPFDNACHLHSSTFNPMYCGHAILQFGPKGSLAELRRRGFKTFSQWWDESYDDIDSDWNRFDALCQIVLELSLKSKEQMLEMYIEMKDTLQHNSDLIYNYDIHNNLTNKIMYNDRDTSATI